MSEEKDKLSPYFSPNKLTSSGVKKVNNVPLYMVIGIICAFALLIAMVASKKAIAQKSLAPKIKIHTPSGYTLKMADEVIQHNKKPPAKENKILLPLNSELTTKSQFLEPATDNSITIQSDVSEAEIERIRQEKTQQFEEAVKAQITVSYNKEKISSMSHQGTAHQTLAIAPNAGQLPSFKEQLKLLQTSANNNIPDQTASNIGGSENESRWQLKSKLQTPSSLFELRAGAVIPGVLISGIRSELNGQIIGQVSQDVFDTATGNYLLIPQGTKLVGVYSNDVKFGQDSVLVAWQRLVFPDGKALDIGGMSGSDRAGYAGFRDEVDHHYARIYGSAVLMSGIVAAISYTQNRNQAAAGFAAPTAGQALSQALGQQLGETTSQLIAKNINTAPTINIRPGYEFNVTVTKDLVFKHPYQQFAY